MTRAWVGLRRTLGIAGVAALACAGDVVAAPQQLLNRHITIGWTGTIVEPTGCTPWSLTTASEHVTYVSSAERLFARSTRSGGNMRSSHDIAPGAAGPRAVRFQGNRVVGNLAMGSGAWQFAVSFSPDYRSCN